MREGGECSGDKIGALEVSEEGQGHQESEGDVVTWDPVQEGEGDHMEEVGVGSVQPQL